MVLATHQPGAHKTIVLSGGGTGGHITPILAVARELKRLDPLIRIVYVGERGGKFLELTAGHEAIDESHAIWAGKFRRYHGESWLKRLLDIKTNLLNVRDLFYFALGTVQAWFLLRKLRPDTVFLKGGFVGVPVGLAAASRHIPFMTHDSDAIPGLANRIVSRWATLHAVALEPSSYSYPSDKTVQVGVLVEGDFQTVTTTDQAAFKAQIGVPVDHTMLLITGGSSGAHNLNKAVVAIADTLLRDYPRLHIVHQTGKGKTGIYGKYVHNRLRAIEFMRPMFAYTGAADMVVSRASGNTLAELGVQAKAVVAVANPLLAGGHQLENAKELQRQQAALIVSETAAATDARELEEAVRRLLDDPDFARQLAQKLHASTLTGAAEKLAAQLINL